MSLGLTVYPSFIPTCYTPFQVKIQLSVLSISIDRISQKVIFLRKIIVTRPTHHFLVLLLPSYHHASSLQQSSFPAYRVHCKPQFQVFPNILDLESRSSATFLPDFRFAATFPNLGAADSNLEAGRNKHMKQVPRGSATDNNVHSRSKTRKAKMEPNMFASNLSYTSTPRLRHYESRPRI
jgi:hypothetical protein